MRSACLYTKLNALTTRHIYDKNSFIHVCPILVALPVIYDFFYYFISQFFFISINQSIKIICNAHNVVHKLESEARAVASGRVLIVIEKVGLEVFFESI